MYDGQGGLCTAMLVWSFVTVWMWAMESRNLFLQFPNGSQIFYRGQVSTDILTHPPQKSCKKSEVLVVKVWGRLFPTRFFGRILCAENFPIQGNREKSRKIEKFWDFTRPPNPKLDILKGILLTIRRNFGGNCSPRGGKSALFILLWLPMGVCLVEKGPCPTSLTLFFGRERTLSNLPKGSSSTI